MQRISIFKFLVTVTTLLLTVNTGSAFADEYATAAELNLMEGFPPPPDKRVNKSKALMAAPYNRWSYQNMRMFYPSAGIPAADKAAERNNSFWGKQNKK